MLSGTLLEFTIAYKIECFFPCLNMKNVDFNIWFESYFVQNIKIYFHQKLATSSENEYTETPDQIPQIRHKIDVIHPVNPAKGKFYYGSYHPRFRREWFFNGNLSQRLQNRSNFHPLFAFFSKNFPFHNVWYMYVYIYRYIRHVYKTQIMCVYIHRRLEGGNTGTFQPSSRNRNKLL